MFSIPKSIPVFRPQSPIPSSSETLDRPIPIPFIALSPPQLTQLPVPKVEAPIPSAPVAIPVPVMTVAAPATIPIPHLTTSPRKNIPLSSTTDLSSVSEPKSTATAVLDPVHNAVPPAFSTNLPTVTHLPQLRVVPLEVPSSLAVDVHAHERAGAVAADTDAVGKDVPLEAETKGISSVAERSEADYSKWVYPAPRLPRPLSVDAGYLGVLAAPQAWAAPRFEELDPAAVDVVPAPMCPDYVMFGGAQYHSFFPFSMRSRSGKDQSNLKLESSPENLSSLVELKRIQFMLDQLKVAQRYLQLRRAEAEALIGYEQAPVSAPQGDDQDGLPREREVDLAPTDVEKGTLWTLAWAGTAAQLQGALGKLCCGSNALDALGYVTLGRHQWGLKRIKGEYVLGLGMKATALQFAAVSGRLDNVIVLISNGAADRFSPRLCDILPKPVYKLLKSALKKSSVRKKPVIPLQASSVPLEGNPSNFPKPVCFSITAG
ncbi:unnamed protein product [Phytomonas sp. EM1]|nr:unnamed protein product [Phytomonas sp. EM1]|eukprot:CCW63195.1 unnamed protein product [Phytomonas sp. isolate EM1]